MSVVLTSNDGDKYTLETTEGWARTDEENSDTKYVILTSGPYKLKVEMARHSERQGEVYRISLCIEKSTPRKHIPPTIRQSYNISEVVF